MGWFPLGIAPGSIVVAGHNGKKTQVNMETLLQGGDYAWLNAMKGASLWSYADFRARAVTPDVLDADGYLKSSSGDAAVGVVCNCYVPSQAQRPGAYIVKWDGDTALDVGGVDLGGPGVVYAITAITQSGTIQTFTCSTPTTYMRAGQPIYLQNIDGAGGWGNLQYKGWRVLDVNPATSSFRIDSGVNYTGALDPLTTAKALFVTNTTVENVAGRLNGSGRYVIQPNPLIGGADGNNMNCGVRSIASPTNYPKNIRICHQDDEAALDAGNEFTPLYLSKMANFGVLRFLDWQQANNNTSSTWNTRKQRSYFSYNASMLVQSFYAGATTALTGATYTVGAPAINSATGAAYAGILDKTTIHVKFAHSYRATATFTGTIAFHSGVGWELTVNSGLTGFVAIGQTVTITGVPIDGDLKIISGSGTVWQLDPVRNIAAVGPVSMTTRQNFSSPLVVFAAAANISIPNHVYQIGDQISFYKHESIAVFPSNVTEGANYYVAASAPGPTGTIQISASPTLTPILTPNAASTGGIKSSIVLFLNAPGTSANPKRILSEYSGKLGDNTNSYPQADTYRELGTLHYDATLDAWVKYGGDVSMGGVGITNGAPIESMLNLAWTVGAHPWLVSPPWAMDPMTDWWPNVMLYDKTNRPAWAKLRIEPPNELWNTFTNFFQTTYAQAKVTAYNAADPTNWPIAGDFHNWYGKVLSTLGQMAYQIYGAGNLDVTYQVVGGVQTAGDTINHLNRFRAAAYVGAGAVQGPLTGAWGTVTFTAVPPVPWSGAPAATRYASHIATATYYSSNAIDGRGGGGPQTLASLATQYGGIQFKGTIASGVLTVTEGSQPSTLYTIFLPLGYGNVTVTGGSAGAGWTLSNSSLNIPYEQTYLAAKTAGLSAADAMADSVIDTVVNATVAPNGVSFHINSIVSGNTVGVGLQIYGGSVIYPNGPEIASGTYPDFTLAFAVSPQTANFAVGLSFSLTGCFRKWQIWGQWANTNFGITKMTAYEGGMSNDFLDSPFEQIVLKARSKQAASVQTYSTQMFDNFRGLGAFPYPAGMTGEYPSNFLMTGRYPLGGAWTMLDDIYQDPPSPQWASLLAYNGIVAPPTYALAAVRNFVSEGDSITSVSNWAGKAAYRSLPGYNTKANRAVPGHTLRDRAAAAAGTDALIVPGARNVLSLLIGANGLGDTVTYPSVNTWISELKAYCDARRAAGWYLLLATILPQGDTGGVNTFNTRRNIVNPEIRLWTTNGSLQPGKHADLIIDLAADSIMGVDNSFGINPTYWSDVVHPAPPGYTRMENIGLVTLGGGSAVSVTGVAPPSVTRLLTLTPRREVGTAYTSRLAVAPDCNWTLQAGSDAGFTLSATNDYISHPAGTIGSYVANLRGVDSFGNIYTAALTLSVTAVDGGVNIFPNGGHYDTYFMSDLSDSSQDGNLAFGIEEFSGNPAFYLTSVLGVGFPQYPQGNLGTVVNGALYECTFIGWKNGVGTATLALSTIDAVFSMASPATVPTRVQGTYVSSTSVSTGTTTYMNAATTAPGEKGWWDEIEVRRVLGPLLSSEIFTPTGGTTAQVSAVTGSGSGTMYCVLTTSILRPTKAQIKAGQNQLGAAAPWSGSLPVSGPARYTFNASGLTSATVYYAHFVHEVVAGFSNTLSVKGQTS